MRQIKSHSIIKIYKERWSYSPDLWVLLYVLCAYNGHLIKNILWMDEIFFNTSVRSQYRNARTQLCVAVGDTDEFCSCCTATYLCAPKAYWMREERTQCLCKVFCSVIVEIHVLGDFLIYNNLNGNKYIEICLVV